MNQVKSLEAAFVWGAGGRCSADHRPAGGVRHAYHGGHARCGRWRGGCCFYPCLWYGGAPAALSSEESNRRCCWLSAGRLTLFLSALKKSVGDRQPFASDRRRSGGDPLRAGLVVAVLGAIVLLFQALLLAHGGLTTLGANGMSMAVIGPMVGYLVWKRPVGRGSVAMSGSFSAPCWRI